MRSFGVSPNVLMSRNLGAIMREASKRPEDGGGKLLFCHAKSSGNSWLAKTCRGFMRQPWFIQILYVHGVCRLQLAARHAVIDLAANSPQVQMMKNNFLNFLAILGIASASPAALAQEEEQQPDGDITVIGKSKREAVEALGKAITRPSRTGKPVARFNDPVCVKVSGLPAEMADLVAERIRDNIREIGRLAVANPDCKPNAFVGILSNVNETVDKLRKDEPWLFDGLLSYQIDRIYEGSQAARAWHVFDLRNLDGSTIPGRRKGGTGVASAGETVNTVERASRISQLRTDLTGAVVLIETAALSGKNFRQLADYATIRILASTSDEIDDERAYLPTILTLFSGEYPPAELTEFDLAYLRALYELPANSRDGQIIAAATSRYAKALSALPED